MWMSSTEESVEDNHLNKVARTCLNKKRLSPFQTRNGDSLTYLSGMPRHAAFPKEAGRKDDYSLRVITARLRRGSL